MCIQDPCKQCTTVCDYTCYDNSVSIAAVVLGILNGIGGLLQGIPQIWKFAIAKKTCGVSGATLYNSLYFHWFMLANYVMLEWPMLMMCQNDMWLCYTNIQSVQMAALDVIGTIVPVLQFVYYFNLEKKEKQKEKKIKDEQKDKREEQNDEINTKNTENKNENQKDNEKQDQNQENQSVTICNSEELKLRTDKNKKDAENTQQSDKNQIEKTKMQKLKEWLTEVCINSWWGLLIMFVVFVISFAIIIPMGLAYSTCNFGFNAVGTAFGVVSGLFACIQYVPQIYLTWTTKLVGSFSVFAQLTYIPGNIAAIVMQILSYNSPLSWIPLIVQLVCEIVLCSILLFITYKDPYRKDNYKQNPWLELVSFYNSFKDGVKGFIQLIKSCCCGKGGSSEVIELETTTVLSSTVNKDKDNIKSQTDKNKINFKSQVDDSKQQQKSSKVLPGLQIKKQVDKRVLQKIAKTEQ